MHKESTSLSHFLSKHGLCPKVTFADEGNLEICCLAIYAKNREEWVVTDFACILSGVTTVTLYDTLGKDSIEHILD